MGMCKAGYFSAWGKQGTTGGPWLAQRLRLLVAGVILLKSDGHAGAARTLVCWSRRCWRLHSALAQSHCASAPVTIC